MDPTPAEMERDLRGRFEAIAERVDPRDERRRQLADTVVGAPQPLATAVVREAEVSLASLRATFARKLPRATLCSCFVDFGDDLRERAAVELALRECFAPAVSASPSDPDEVAATARALIGAAKCTWSLVVARDSALARPTSLRDAVRALRYLHRAMALVTADQATRESLYWLVFNASIVLHDVATAMVQAGAALQAVEFVNWTILILNGNVVLCTVRHLRWRLRFYTLAVLALLQLGHRAAAAAAVEHATTEVARLREQEALDPPIPADVETLLASAESDLKLLSWRVHWREAADAAAKTAADAVQALGEDPAPESALRAEAEPFASALTGAGFSAWREQAAAVVEAGEALDASPCAMGDGGLRGMPSPLPLQGGEKEEEEGAEGDGARAAARGLLSAVWEGTLARIYPLLHAAGVAPKGDSPEGRPLDDSGSVEPGKTQVDTAEGEAKTEAAAGPPPTAQAAADAEELTPALHLRLLRLAVLADWNASATAILLRTLQIRLRARLARLAPTASSGTVDLSFTATAVEGRMGQTTGSAEPSGDVARPQQTMRHATAVPSLAASSALTAATDALSEDEAAAMEAECCLLACTLALLRAVPVSSVDAAAAVAEAARAAVAPEGEGEEGEAAPAAAADDALCLRVQARGGRPPHGQGDSPLWADEDEAMAAASGVGLDTCGEVAGASVPIRRMYALAAAVAGVMRGRWRSVLTWRPVALVRAAALLWRPYCEAMLSHVDALSPHDPVPPALARLLATALAAVREAAEGPVGDPVLAARAALRHTALLREMGEWRRAVSGARAALDAVRAARGWDADAAAVTGDPVPAPSSLPAGEGHMRPRAEPAQLALATGTQSLALRLALGPRAGLDPAACGSEAAPGDTPSWQLGQPGGEAALWPYHTAGTACSTDQEHAALACAEAEVSAALFLIELEWAARLAERADAGEATDAAAVDHRSLTLAAPTLLGAPRTADSAVVPRAPGPGAAAAVLFRERGGVETDPVGWPGSAAARAVAVASSVRRKRPATGTGKEGGEDEEEEDEDEEEDEEEGAAGGGRHPSLPPAVASAVAAACSRLSSECRRNLALSALLCTQRALAVADPYEQREAFADAARLLREAKAEEKALVEGALAKGKSDSSGSSGSGPEPPAFVARSHSTIQVRVPSYKGPRGKRRAQRPVAWFRVFAREAGSGTAVSTSSADLDGTGVRVRDASQPVSLRSLVPNEAYAVAVAAYDDEDRPVGGIGATSTPIVAQSPLPLELLWAMLSQTACALGHEAAARGAADTLRRLFVARAEEKPLWAESPFVRDTLRRAALAVAPEPVLWGLSHALRLLAEVPPPQESALPAPGSAPGGGHAPGRAIDDDDGTMGYGPGCEGEEAEEEAMQPRTPAAPLEQSALARVRLLCLAAEVCTAVANWRGVRAAVVRAYSLLCSLLRTRQPRPVLLAPLLTLHQVLQVVPLPQWDSATRTVFARVAYELQQLAGPLGETELAPSAVFRPRLRWDADACHVAAPSPENDPVALAKAALSGEGSDGAPTELTGMETPAQRGLSHVLQLSRGGGDDKGEVGDDLLAVAAGRVPPSLATADATAGGDSFGAQLAAKLRSDPTLALEALLSEGAGGDEEGGAPNPRRLEWICRIAAAALARMDPATAVKALDAAPSTLPGHGAVADLSLAREVVEQELTEEAGAAAVGFDIALPPEPAKEDAGAEEAAAAKGAKGSKGKKGAPEQEDEAAAKEREEAEQRKEAEEKRCRMAYLSRVAAAGLTVRRVPDPGDQYALLWLSRLERLRTVLEAAQERAQSRPLAPEASDGPLAALEYRLSEARLGKNPLALPLGQELGAAGQQSTEAMDTLQEEEEEEEEEVERDGEGGEAKEATEQQQEQEEEAPAADGADGEGRGEGAALTSRVRAAQGVNRTLLRLSRAAQRARWALAWTELHNAVVEMWNVAQDAWTNPTLHAPPRRTAEAEEEEDDPLPGIPGDPPLRSRPPTSLDKTSGAASTATAGEEKEGEGAAEGADGQVETLASTNPLRDAREAVARGTRPASWLDWRPWRRASHALLDMVEIRGSATYGGHGGVASSAEWAGQPSTGSPKRGGEAAEGDTSPRAGGGNGAGLSADEAGAHAELDAMERESDPGQPGLSSPRTGGDDAAGEAKGEGEEEEEEEEPPLAPASVDTPTISRGQMDSIRVFVTYTVQALACASWWTEVVALGLRAARLTGAAPLVNTVLPMVVFAQGRLCGRAQTALEAAESRLERWREEARPEEGAGTRRRRRRQLVAVERQLSPAEQRYADGIERFGQHVAACRARVEEREHLYARATALRAAMQRDRNRAEIMLDGAGRALAAFLRAQQQPVPPGQGARGAAAAMLAELGAEIGGDASADGTSVSAGSSSAGSGTSAAGARRGLRRAARRIGRLYAKAVGDLRKRRDTRLLVPALHTVGDLYFFVGDAMRGRNDPPEASGHARAAAQWHDAIDAVLGRMNGARMWRAAARECAETGEPLVQRYSLWGTLQAGTVMAKLARHCCSRDGALRSELWQGACTMFAAPFQYSALHPARACDFALFRPVFLWRGEDLAAQPWRLRPFALREALRAAALGAIGDGSPVAALPVLSLWQFVVDSHTRDEQEATVVALLRMRALAHCGRPAAALRVFEEVLRGAHLPLAARRMDDASQPVECDPAETAAAAVTARAAMLDGSAGGADGDGEEGAGDGAFPPSWCVRRAAAVECRGPEAEENAEAVAWLVDDAQCALSASLATVLGTALTRALALARCELLLRWAPEYPRREAERTVAERMIAAARRGAEAVAAQVAAPQGAPGDAGEQEVEAAAGKGAKVKAKDKAKDKAKGGGEEATDAAGPSAPLRPAPAADGSLCAMTLDAVDAGQLAEAGRLCAASWRRDGVFWRASALLRASIATVAKATDPQLAAVVMRGAQEAEPASEEKEEKQEEKKEGEEEEEKKEADAGIPAPRGRDSQWIVRCVEASAAQWLALQRQQLSCALAQGSMPLSAAALDVALGAAGDCHDTVATADLTLLAARADVAAGDVRVGCDALRSLLASPDAERAPWSARTAHGALILADLLRQQAAAMAADADADAGFLREAWCSARRGERILRGLAFEAGWAGATTPLASARQLPSERHTARLGAALTQLAELALQLGTEGVATAEAQYAKGERERRRRERRREIEDSGMPPPDEEEEGEDADDGALAVATAGSGAGDPYSPLRPASATAVACAEEAVCCLVQRGPNSPPRALCRALLALAEALHEAHGLGVTAGGRAAAGDGADALSLGCAAAPVVTPGTGETEEEAMTRQEGGRVRVAAVRAVQALAQREGLVSEEAAEGEAPSDLLALVARAWSSTLAPPRRAAEALQCALAVAWHRAGRDLAVLRDAAARLADLLAGVTPAPVWGEEEGAGLQRGFVLARAHAVSLASLAGSGQAQMRRAASTDTGAGAVSGGDGASEAVQSAMAEVSALLRHDQELDEAKTGARAPPEGSGGAGEGPGARLAKNPCSSWPFASEATQGAVARFADSVRREARAVEAWEDVGLTRLAADAAEALHKTCDGIGGGVFGGLDKLGPVVGAREAPAWEAGHLQTAWASGVGSACALLANLGPVDGEGARSVVAVVDADDSGELARQWMRLRHDVERAARTETMFDADVPSEPVAQADVANRVLEALGELQQKLRGKGAAAEGMPDVEVSSRLVRRVAGVVRLDRGLSLQDEGLCRWLTTAIA